MYESGRCWMPLVPAPTGLPGPAAVSSASSSQPGWSPWLLRYQTPRVPKPARYHELDRLPCPLRRSAARRAFPLTPPSLGVMLARGGQYVLDRYRACASVRPRLAEDGCPELLRLERGSVIA